MEEQKFSDEAHLFVNIKEEIDEQQVDMERQRTRWPTLAMENFDACRRCLKKIILTNQFPNFTHLRLMVCPGNSVDDQLFITMCDSRLADGEFSLDFDYLHSHAPIVLERVINHNQGINIMRSLLYSHKEHRRATELQHNFLNIYNSALDMLNYSYHWKPELRSHPIIIDVQSRRNVIFVDVKQM